MSGKRKLLAVTATLAVVAVAGGSTVITSAQSAPAAAAPVAAAPVPATPAMAAQPVATPAHGPERGHQH